jgi:uncharacterized membrane protein
MKTIRPIVYAALLALAFAVTALAADTPSVSFEFTAVKIPRASQVFPAAISNAGVSVGTYVDKNNNGVFGYKLDGTRLVRLDLPNSKRTYATGIKPDGLSVVGIYVNSANKQLGFLFKNGKFTDIPGPAGSILSGAYGINDAGHIVGLYEDGHSVGGFLLEGIIYTTRSVPTSTETFAYGINNHNKVVLGWLNSADAQESSLYDGKMYKTIDVPGATNTAANGINAAGDIVYAWVDGNNIEHGALRHAGKFYKFDYPKAAQSFGAGINDNNVIVGAYQAVSNGPWRAFQATYK